MTRSAARWVTTLVLACAGMADAAASGPAATSGALQPCRLEGFPHEALCGHVRRPLDPAVPAGRQIDVHFAVLPALARHKHADPVFVFAGGPGQSATELAGSWARLLARLSNRRDIVLVDQRG
ncbi:MAG: alpha/beta hydrolase, partial [Rubrivivax sp.]|nr:alpha/beta hydrolase [Rubrivivax sp.]